MDGFMCDIKDSLLSMNIVKWSSQGMLRLTQEAMNELFQPTISNIVKHIGEKHKDTRTEQSRFVLTSPNL